MQPGGCPSLAIWPKKLIRIKRDSEVHGFVFAEFESPVPPPPPQKILKFVFEFNFNRFVPNLASYRVAVPY